MKIKLLTIISSVLLWSGCSQNEEFPNAASSSQENVYKTTRSVDDAVEIANTILSLEYSNSRNTTVVTSQNVVTVSSHNSRSEADTLMYAVNIGQGEGYMLIAAPTDITPLLAITENGTYEDAVNSDNEGLKYALDQTTQYIRTNSKSIGNPTINDSLTPILPPPFIKQSYDEIKKYNIKKGPNVEVCWGQYWPENMYCPNHIAGCGPVAIAQILSYFKQPLTINYTYPNHEVTAEILSWDGILMHKFSGYYSTPTTTEIESHLENCTAAECSHETIGRIVREIGHRCNAQYDPSGTGITISAAKSTLDGILNLNYTTKYVERPIDLVDLFEDTKGDGVAYVRAQHTLSNNTTEGHAWVADGAWLTGRKVYHYVYDSSMPTNYRLESTKDEVTRYLHFNWGYNGRSNGFFLLNVFDPTEGKEYDHPELGNASNQCNEKFRGIWITKK